MQAIAKKALAGVCGGICLVSSSMVLAKNFGTFGETYPIVEVSFIEAITAKMKEMVENGEWEKHKQKYIKETIDGFKRPKGAQLPHVTVNQVRHIDPSIILQTDIKMPDGSYLARAGDKINPLKQMNISQPMAFIDGDDEGQVQWALKKHQENPSTVIIVVSGNWFDLGEKHKVKFWFDQTGEFINRLDIQRTPCFVTQDGMRMKIDEVAL